MGNRKITLKSFFVMATVWKIGSRWSDNGDWRSCILSIFRRNNIVFIGSKETERFRRKEVKEEDYFAIADGYTVVAVAKAISNPFCITDIKLKFRSSDYLDSDTDLSYAWVCRVKIVDLDNSQRFLYQKPGAFYEANNEISKKVISLFENDQSNKFDIKAKTYRIYGEKEDDDKSSIINSNTVFSIPVYQREYSWGYDQINRFVSDIFSGFWGNDEEKEIVCDPMFIGTMQLSYKKYIDEKESEQDVIDGQQRLSTILCFLKYLKLKYPNVAFLNNISLDWLETRVNNGKENDYLVEMLSLENIDEVKIIDDSTPNKYLKNIHIIDEIFVEHTADDEQQELPLFSNNIEEFINYFLSDINLVVVETLAGLSKTIQIFNTINTAGLDLNGNDLFKVHLYEYLHDHKNKGEETFNEIGEIYKDVKNRNNKWRKTHDWDVITIDDVRSIYQKYIISKYELSKSLYQQSSDKFFEELFDTLLNIQTHKDLNIKGKNVELSLEDLKRIVEVAYFWNSSDYPSTEGLLSDRLINCSRYSRYNDIAYQILLSNENLQKKDRISQVYTILEALSKLFFCYSVRYSKSVYEIRGFMGDVYHLVYNLKENIDDILAKIKSKIDSLNTQDFVDHYIGSQIAHNRVWKSLICILSDYFDEIEEGKSLKDIQDVFDLQSDIEHIHANANDKECVDITDDLQNCIGNLMLLESEINRSIGKLPFQEKIDRAGKKLCYKDSKFATVNKISKHKKWGIQDIEKRREEELEKIAKFLFG